jgi:hypothetical protein
MSNIVDRLPADDLRYLTLISNRILVSFTQIIGGNSRDIHPTPVLTLESCIPDKQTITAVLVEATTKTELEEGFQLGNQRNLNEGMNSCIVAEKNHTERCGRLDFTVFFGDKHTSNDVI